MKKIFKSMLAVLIVFMQLSSPMLVFADTFEEEVINEENIDDNEEIVEDEIVEEAIEEEKVEEETIEEDNVINEEKEEVIEEENTNDVEEVVEKQEVSVKKGLNNIVKSGNSEKESFDINAIVSDSKIKIDVKKNSDNNYIANLKVIFNNVLDGDVKNKIEVEKTIVVDNNTLELDDIGANLNGNYNLEAFIYKVDNDMSSESEDSLKNYISSLDSYYEDSIDNFYENNIETSISLYVDGSSDISCSNKTCTMPANASDKDINVLYSSVVGDKDTTNSHIKYIMNSELEYDSMYINFNSLLYGTYVIEGILYNSNDEEIASDTLTINYGSFSDNENIVDYFTNDSISDDDKARSMTLLDEDTKKSLFDEFVSASLSSGLSCEMIIDDDMITSEECYGRIVDSDTLPLVSEIIQAFNNNGMTASIDGGNSSDYVSTNMVLNVSLFGIEKQYTFVIKGDIDNDLVEDSDANKIVDYLFGNGELDKYEMKAADVNLDDNVDMLDVSMMAAAICVQSWFYPEPREDTIVAGFEGANLSNLNVGDTFSINLVLSGFDNDYINGISSLLKYDSSIIELVDYSINSILEDYGDLVDNKLINVGLETYSDDGVLVTFNFKAIKSGSSNIKLKDLVLGKDGISLDVTNNASIDVTISEDESNDNNNNNNSSSSSSPVVYFGEEESSNSSEPVVSFIENKIYYSDYLSLLEIKGYDIDFNKYILEYSITVDSDVDSLDITALAEDRNASVRIYGNSNFKEGENIVKVIVTAQDGSERTYIIKVNKLADDSIEKIDVDDDNAINNNMEKTIVIILIILVALGLLYLIFKKDE